MKRVLYTLLLMLLCIACNDDLNKSENLILQPGNYEVMFSVGVSGGNNYIATKTIDEQGRFTTDYKYEYIYLHSIDNPSKVLKFPVQLEEEACGEGCKGFRMYIHVGEDEKVTIYNWDPDGEENPSSSNSVELNAHENIYFSSQENDVWSATSVKDEVSPLTGQPVFVRNENTNVEMFRSENYTANGLNGLTNIGYELTMNRVCSAYQVRCVITDISNDVMGDQSLYALSKQQFEEKSGTKMEDWTIKLYLGDLFPYTYDLSKSDKSQRVSYGEGNTGGYYVTNNQTYTNLNENRTVSISNSDEEDNVLQYRGLGLVTTSEYLITPVDESTDKHMNAYVFIKYNPSETSDNKSDEGAKYVKIPIEDLPGRTNYTEQVNIVIDIAALLGAFQDEINAPQSSNPNEASTKNLYGGLEQIYLNPLVFHQ